MKKEFTKDYILKNKGCYETQKVETLSFINKETITIDDLLNSEMPFKDKGWWLIRKCELTTKEKVELAYELAIAVLPIFEKKYPEDKRVRECFEAIKAFNNGEINVDQLRVKRQSARNAAYAAYAAYAADAADADADAAADAAYAADAAADAAAAYAAYAADAAADAAYAADAAADAADAAYQKIILETLINFVKTH